MLLSVFLQELDSTICFNWSVQLHTSECQNICYTRDWNDVESVASGRLVSVGPCFRP